MKRLNVILVYNKEQDRILMCKREKEPYKGKYNFVGGKVEEEENELLAAYRELQEETGITEKDIKLKHIMDFKYYMTNIELEVFSGVLNKDINLIEEINKLYWIDKKDNFFDLMKYAGEGNIGHIVEMDKKIGRYKYMSIEISKMVEKDIPEVVDIQINGWRQAYRGIIDQDFLDSMNREERIEKNRNNYLNVNTYVAKIDNEVVGFFRYTVPAREIYGEEYDSELVGIYVKPDKKGLGIGRVMFEYVQNKFRELDKHKMILWCLKDNYPSRGFYEKMGGKIVKEKDIEIGGKRYLEVGFEYEL